MSIFDEIDYEVFANEFYVKLFALIPEVEHLFPNVEKQKLMIVVALQSINDKDQPNDWLADYARELGEKHRKARVSEQHIVDGRKAFYDALDIAGTTLKPERRQIYVDAYLSFEKAMRSAMNL